MLLLTTVSDKEKERNVLLKEFIKIAPQYYERYGIEFHALDMRWGIPGEVNISITIDLVLYEQSKVFLDRNIRFSDSITAD